MGGCIYIHIYNKTNEVLSVSYIHAKSLVAHKCSSKHGNIKVESPGFLLVMYLWTVKLKALSMNCNNSLIEHIYTGHATQLPWCCGEWYRKCGHACGGMYVECFCSAHYTCLTSICYGLLHTHAHTHLHTL